MLDEVSILLESRKKTKEKRPRFAEDIINFDFCFHFGLLSPFCVTARGVTTKQSPDIARRLLRAVALAMTLLMKNSFIHSGTKECFDRLSTSSAVPPRLSNKFFYLKSLTG